jgi:hypothetical protein
VSGEWRDKFGRAFLRTDNLTVLEKKKLWFLGYIPELNDWELVPYICIVVFQFTIWEQNLQRRAPSFNSVFLLYKEELYTVLSGNHSWGLDYEKLQIPLRRILAGPIPDGGAGDAQGDRYPGQHQQAEDAGGREGQGGRGRGGAGGDDGQDDRVEQN